MTTSHIVVAFRPVLNAIRKATSRYDNDFWKYAAKIGDDTTIADYIDESPNDISVHNRKLIIKNVIRQRINKLLDERYGVDNPDLLKMIKQADNITDKT